MAYQHWYSRKQRIGRRGEGRKIEDHGLIECGGVSYEDTKSMLKSRIDVHGDGSGVWEPPHCRTPNDDD